MKKEVEGLIELRLAVADDLNFILATWMRGLCFGNEWFREIDRRVFKKVYREVLIKILSRPGVQVRIAALKDESGVILGYSVSENNILHWIHVREAWRHQGIAKDLVPQNIGTVTHLTAVGLSLKPQAWKFNPFLV